MSAQSSLQQVADYFISLSDETGELISNLKLQKLVYYAQTWHLGLLGVPLFEEECQAWVHGPVVPELYHIYKHHRWQPLQRPDLEEGSLSKIEESFSPETKEILESVRDMYFSRGAFELEIMSHAEMPWRKARGNYSPDDLCTTVIEKEWMQEWAAQYANLVQA